MKATFRTTTERARPTTARARLHAFAKAVVDDPGLLSGSNDQIASILDAFIKENAEQTAIRRAEAVAAQRVELPNGWIKAGKAKVIDVFDSWGIRQ